MVSLILLVDIQEIGVLADILIGVFHRVTDPDFRAIEKFHHRVLPLVILDPIADKELQLFSILTGIIAGLRGVENSVLDIGLQAAACPGRRVVFSLAA